MQILNIIIWRWIIIKKLTILITIIFCLFFTSCTSERSKNLELREEIKVEDKLDKEVQDFIESNINYIDLKEDIKMTDNIQDKKNIDYLLNPSFNDIEGSTNTKLSNQIFTKTFNEYEDFKFDIDLKYKKYLMPKEYLLITKERVNIYEKPSFQSMVIGEASYFEKIKVLNEVEGDVIKTVNSNKWFYLTWNDGNGINKKGYVPESEGVLRRFRFDHMYNSILNLEETLNSNKFAYISNYKNINGSPPLINNKGLDNYGMQAYQSAPAYIDINNLSNFRYFPDGMIVIILEKIEDYYKVKGLDYEGEYWIPERYISFDNNLENLDKVVVVDTTNQNQGVFEKIKGQWTMISYGLSTTGAKGKLAYETPEGKFKVQEKKERFYYLNGNGKELAGYAPYAVRFAQGAYIHGVPVDFIRKNNEKVDPGIKEYLFTIGTMPRSHKCVRNYTSSAKFIYEWADPNNTAVIVIK